MIEFGHCSFQEMVLHRASPVTILSTIVGYHYVGRRVLIVYTGLIYHLADD